jgi:hypothetical protein
MGLLQPGRSSTYWLPRTFAKIDAGSEADSDAGNGAGNAITVINLRAKVGRLIISWRSRTTDTMSDSAETDTGTEAGTTDASTNNDSTMSDSAGTNNASIDEDMTVVIIPVELVRHFDGSYRFYFRCPGRDTNNASTNATGTMEADMSGACPASVKCGRRVLKLHFVGLQGRRHFLCRHCSKFSYTSQFADPRQQALRRANKLWRRLAGTEDAAEAVQLIAKAMQAETQATEAHTAQLQRLIAWLDHRRGPQFTL